MRPGRRVSPVLAALALVIGAGAQSADDVTAIVGAALIDGTGAPPLADSAVVIEGERIAAVGRREHVAIPEGARVIDAHGKWIIPGLVDAHVHFFQSGGLYTRPDVVDLRDVRSYEDERARVRDRLPMTFARYLASGVTAVLDIGGPFWNFAIRKRARNTLLAPRVAVAGPLLGTYAPSELAHDDPAIIRVTSADEARTLVRRQLAHGPDIVKLWLIKPPALDMEREFEWVHAAIDESRRGGVRVAAHATQREVARAAARAGAVVLAHSVRDRRLDDGLIALMKARDVVYITTFVAREGYHEVLGQRVELSDIERRLGDPDEIASFADVAAIDPARIPAWFRRGAPRTAIPFANLRRAQAAGITIAAGTDAGNIGTLHGPAIHRELELMAEAGLSPMEVIVAATRGGAKAMGRADELGTIEAGKLADLVLLDANPLADIRNARRIHRVVKGGAVIDPKAILSAAREAQRPAPRWFSPAGGRARRRAQSPRSRRWRGSRRRGTSRTSRCRGR